MRTLLTTLLLATVAAAQPQIPLDSCRSKGA